MANDREYIDREAAMTLETSITCDPDAIEAVMEGMALFSDHIRSLPAADVEEVVRCEDCVSYIKTGKHGINRCQWLGILTHDGFYCADGKRKEI